MSDVDPLLAPATRGLRPASGGDRADLVHGSEKAGPALGRSAEPGVWTVSVLPISTRPTGVSVTVRDQIPGNWCTLEDGTGGIISGRWKVGNAPITGQAYLHGSDGVLGNGVCLDGGIGGSGWFPIGNPESFYVVADGLVSVSRG